MSNEQHKHKHKHKKKSRVLDFIFGMLVAITALLLGTVIAVEVYTDNPFSLFNRGNGMLSDLLYIANIIYILALWALTTTFAIAWCYNRDRLASFVGMEVIFVLTIVAYFLCWVYSAVFSGVQPVIHTLYKVCMVLQIPFSSISRGAAACVTHFSENTRMKVDGIRALAEVFLVLAPVVPAALIIVREMDRRTELRRKHKLHSKAEQRRREAARAAQKAAQEAAKQAAQEATETTE